MTAKPSGRARVTTTSIVCGWQSEATKKRVSALSLHASCASDIASAAAVPSSSSEAFARSRPVRSAIIVW